MPVRLWRRGLVSPLLSRASTGSRAGWACANCRLQSPATRASSTSTAVTEKPYYITSPIFYVNAAPHVGHMYTMILTDILKRWQMLKGNRALLCTGTDEHGMKIQQAAAKAGSDPLPFCDKGADVFKNLAARIGISYDHFVRTTEPAHREAVEYAWYLLRERGYIYTSKHEGWYSVSDETFYPPSTVHLIIDPPTGRKMMVSMETGTEVQWTSEENYHFRLSAFRDQLLEFYERNPEWIIPASRMKEVVHSVSEGLEDLSISRPTERLSWGIQVPDDESQTIYVWLDALVNYITKAGYPFPPGQEHAGGWPADCQVIGKDIVRFHCIYWPAFLMALGLPLPSRILTHAHWTLSRQKMSKSTGNVVNPFFALDRFGIDVMRYYLAHDGGIEHDSDYSNQYIIERYLKGLQNGMGNLTSRITRGKKWSVRGAVEWAQHNVVQNAPNEDLAGRHRLLLISLRDEVNSKMDSLDSRAALHTIMDAIYEANRYLQHSAPWSLATKASGIPDDPTHDPPPRSHLEWQRKGEISRETAQAHVDTCVFLCAETLRICGILLQPYMPEKAAKLLDMLGIDGGRRTFVDAVYGADAEYGTSKIELGRGGPGGTLFPPLDSDT